MDFLNKLRQEADGEGQTHASGPADPTGHNSHEATKHEAEPERDFLGKLIAGSGSHSSHHEHGASKASFLDKLTRKEEREKKAVELAAREAEIKVELEKVAHDKKENEGFFERIKDHFDGEEGSAEPKRPEHHAGGASSFFNKLTGKEEREKKAAELDRKEAELRAELERVEDEKRDNEGILQRLKDHLDGEEDEDLKSGKHQEDKPSFLDKITGKAAEEERLRKEEEEKSALDKMKDRLNEGMGGGRKAEKNEDFLDKSERQHHPFPTFPYHIRVWLTKFLAIDKFQEHVLHKGDQSNESAWEQMKDDKIADAIRTQLHIKDKDGDK